MRSTSEPFLGRPGIAADVVTSMTAPVPPTRLADATAASLELPPASTVSSVNVLGFRYAMMLLRRSLGFR